MILNKDFKEFIILLNENKVKYLIIGGYAVNLHGYPRYTKDINFWIGPAKKNIQKLISAIKGFGFESLDLEEENFLVKDNIIQLGRAPNRIDLLTNVDGIVFEKCFSRKNQVKVDNTKINYLAIEDLITAKRTTGRLQDMADAEQLKKIKNSRENN